ncbi:MAG: D-sedoheptulose-7-phosphate isomerase, partial [Chloroflexota bacterium]
MRVNGEARSSGRITRDGEDMNQAIHDYLSTIREALLFVDSKALEAVTDRLFEAYRLGHTVFTMGNGASASLASQMAFDLSKGTAPDLGKGPQAHADRRLRIRSLSDNSALLTGYGDDIAYDDVFIEQLKSQLQPNDVVIGLSSSGGSPNVLRALEYARMNGATTIGFTGTQPSALQMRERVDILVQAPLARAEQVEDLHVIFHHIVAIDLQSRLA